MISYVDSIPFQTCIGNTSKARRFSDDAADPAFRAPPVETHVLCGKPLTPVHPERSPHASDRRFTDRKFFCASIQCFRRSPLDSPSPPMPAGGEIARFSNMCSVFVNRT